MLCIVEEIFMRWMVEKIIRLSQIFNIIFICFDSSDIGGRSLSAPFAGIYGIIPCNSWY